MATTKKKPARSTRGKPAARMGRPEKAPEDRKDETIKIKVTVEQKAVLTAAAERDGSDVSTWLRTLGLREARREA